jgi:hypothetical protein
MSKINRTTTCKSIVLIVFLSFSLAAVAAAQTEASMGDIVTLSGYSYTGNTVWLFLTGPNLALNGVALDNIYRAADQGGATQVQVEPDGHWVYKWNTGGAGGRLDAGAYTVWVADGPADLSRLSAVDYNTISVILSVPSITAEVTGGSPQSSGPVTGSMDLSSIPEGASVVVDTAYKGMTPLTVDGLDPGVHNVTFTRFGYAALSTPVTVEAGSVSEVNATLLPSAGALLVITTPAGALLTIDGQPGGISPATVPDLPPGNHTLNMTKEGFIPQILPVPVTAGQTTTVNVTLVAAGLPGVTGTKAAGLLPATVAAGILASLLVVLRRSRTKKS